MNWLLAIAFLALFWLLMESGQLFFAFLSLVIFFLVLIAGAKGGRESHAHVTATRGPVVIRSKKTKFPSVIKIGIKPKWGGTSSAEDMATSAASVLLFPLKMLVGFLKR